MKSLLTSAMLALCAIAAPAWSQELDSDDVKWINECIRDNRDEPGASAKIARGYCFCMNERMSSNESRSITEWEKANPRAKRACEQQAGWK